MQWFLKNYDKAVAAGDLAKIAQLKAERDAAKVDYESDLREMVLFGSRETIAALNRANISAASVLKAATILNSATVQGATGILGVPGAIQELSNTYFVIATDVRKHLGLEPLTIMDVTAVKEGLASRG